ncbi:MAG: hypothetical protein RLZZ29_232 [Cyanobacteriota bacterium]|jgi:hypothetical protein
MVILFILKTVHSLTKYETPLQTSPVFNVIPFPSPKRRGLGRGAGRDFEIVLCMIKKSSF